MISSSKAENLKIKPRDLCISSECPWSEKEKEDQEYSGRIAKAQLFAADKPEAQWGPANSNQTCLSPSQLEDIKAYRQDCSMKEAELKVMDSAFHECENSTCHKSFWQEPEFAILAPIAAIVFGFIIGSSHK